MGKIIINCTNTGFTFHVKAKNGETIAISQVYSKIESCKKGINSVIKNAPAAEIEDQTIRGFIKHKNPKFELYKNDAGSFYFRLKASNGEIIASSQAYTAKASAKNGIRSLKENVLAAEIIDLPKD